MTRAMTEARHAPRPRQTASYAPGLASESCGGDRGSNLRRQRAIWRGMTLDEIITQKMADDGPDSGKRSLLRRRLSHAAREACDDKCHLSAGMRDGGGAE